MLDGQNVIRFAEELAAKYELPVGCKFVVIIRDPMRENYGVGANVDEIETLKILAQAFAGLVHKLKGHAAGGVKG